jgi:hypothetical protein
MMESSSAIQIGGVALCGVGVGIALVNYYDKIRGKEGGEGAVASMLALPSNSERRLRYELSCAHKLCRYFGMDEVRVCAVCM